MKSNLYYARMHVELVPECSMVLLHILCKHGHTQICYCISNKSSPSKGKLIGDIGAEPCLEFLDNFFTYHVEWSAYGMFVVL